MTRLSDTAPWTRRERLASWLWRRRWTAWYGPLEVSRLYTERVGGYERCLPSPVRRVRRGR